MNGQETLPLCFLLDLNGAHINSSMFQPHYYQPNVVQTIVSARLHSSKKRIACKVLIASRQTEWFPAIFPPSVESLVVWLKYLICKKGNNVNISNVFCVTDTRTLAQHFQICLLNWTNVWFTVGSTPCLDILRLIFIQLHVCGFFSATFNRLNGGASEEGSLS